MTEIEQICKAVKRRIRDTKATSLQLLTCSQMGDSPHFAVEPSLVVCDSKTAFYGVFKHYHSAGDYFREIKMDLRKLAEQYERRRLQGRPPSLVLFAVIPVGADTLDHNGFSSGLRMVQDRERLLEAVGLSRLFWGPNTAEAVKCWGEGSLKVDVEVERFLAPLLLRVRKIAAKGDRSEWLDRWQSKTKQAVHDVLQDDRAGSDSGPRADLQQEAWTHLSSQLGSLNSPQREPEQPWLLKSITGLRQFRRFNHKDVPDEVPFGSDLTILYGANGSGKSSLIDAVMLGLAGEVRAAGGKSVVSLEELAHKGDIPPDGKFGELVTAFPPVAVENKKVAQEKERFDIRVRPEDAVPPVDTFCMSQSSLRFFMDMDPARRFDWISERLGLDRSLDRRIDVLLQGLHREIAPHASRFGFVFSHHQLGKMMESFENAVCAHVQSICTAPEFSRAVKAV